MRRRRGSRRDYVPLSPLSQVNRTQVNRRVREFREEVVPVTGWRRRGPQKRWKSTESSLCTSYPGGNLRCRGVGRVRVLLSCHGWVRRPRLEGTVCCLDPQVGKKTSFLFLLRVPDKGRRDVRGRDPSSVRRNSYFIHVLRGYLPILD